MTIEYRDDESAGPSDVLRGCLQKEDQIPLGCETMDNEVYNRFVMSLFEMSIISDSLCRRMPLIILQQSFDDNRRIIVTIALSVSRTLSSLSSVVIRK